MISYGAMPAPAETVEGYVSNASMTKFSTLMDELAELRASDPDFRVIVFTRHTFVQARLVKLISDELQPGGRLAPTEHGSKLVVFEFTQKTAPQQRHRLIQQFQDPSKKGARVFVVTYAVAAVGITLTAANRIFLMEPCIDPAQEIQAAGRIHRLGQEKDCFIKRFAFKDSIEEAVTMIHNKIKNSEIAVVDGVVDAETSRKAMLEYSEGVVTHDRSDKGSTRTRKGSGRPDAHSAPPKFVHGSDYQPQWAYSSEVVKRKGKPAQQRSVIWREENAAFEKGSTYSYTCKEAACACCGLYVDLPGSFAWKGEGLFAYLNGDTRDPPHLAAPARSQYDFYPARVFHDVPRPPDGWKGLPLEETNNGGELPPSSRLQRAGSAISAALSRVARSAGGGGGGESSSS